MTILSNMWKKKLPYTLDDSQSQPPPGSRSDGWLFAGGWGWFFVVFPRYPCWRLPTNCQMGVSKNRGTQNGRFIMEHPIKMDDLGVPLFSETSESYSTWMIFCSICSIIPEHDSMIQLHQAVSKNILESLVTAINPVHLRTKDVSSYFSVSSWHPQTFCTQKMYFKFQNLP